MGESNRQSCSGIIGNVSIRFNMKIANNLGSEIVTPLAAEAMPSGKVTKKTFEYMSNLITDALQDVDLVLLDLHGAMVTEHLFDGEGELLYRIRNLKPNIPIAVTCDLHCNLTVG